MLGGIVIVGLNGSGKTTLGGALARALGWKHMDIEEYAFEPSDIPYEKPRSASETRALLLKDAKDAGRFVFSCVNGDFGEEMNELYACAVQICVPLEERLARVKRRSFAQFGERVLEGGDLYEKEQAFFAFVASRNTDKTEAWLKTLACPVVSIDGLLPIEENVAFLKKRVLGCQKKCF